MNKPLNDLELPDGAVEASASVADDVRKQEQQALLSV